jgi:hypothetical protein
MESQRGILRVKMPALTERSRPNVPLRSKSERIIEHWEVHHESMGDSQACYGMHPGPQRLVRALHMEMQKAGKGKIFRILRAVN